jgi:hypothetical protein
LQNLVSSLNLLLSFFGRLALRDNLFFLAIQILAVIINKSTGNTYITAAIYSFSLFHHFLGNSYLASLVIKSYLFKSNTNKHAYFNRRKLLIKILPEEYIGELQTLQRRWTKQGLTTLEIQLKILFNVLDMFLGLLKCKVENIWLNKNRIE